MQGNNMHTGSVVHLFEGNRGKRPQAVESTAATGVLHRAWNSVAAFFVTAAEIIVEARELEARMLMERGSRRFLDH
jgi:hypothetical protein